MEEMPTVYLAWEAPMGESYERGLWWWVLAISGAGALLAYAIFTQNFAFAVIIVIFGLLLSLSRVFTGKMVQTAIAEKGIVINGTFYPYEAVEEFFLLANPRKLYFTVSGFLRPRVNVMIPEDIDIEELRVVLKENVAENIGMVAEPLSDTISRRLKLF